VRLTATADSCGRRATRSAVLATRALNESIQRVVHILACRIDALIAEERWSPTAAFELWTFPAESTGLEKVARWRTDLGFKPGSRVHRPKRKGPPLLGIPAAFLTAESLGVAERPET
jgi:hypothetical protein